MAPMQRGSLSHIPTGICDFQTLPVCSTGPSHSLEVILVHGCWHVSQKFAKSLYKSARTISRGPVPCRVHIFSYNAAELLLKGKPRLIDLAQALLGHMTTLSTESHKALAVVAHSTAIWLVQAAVVDWQYVSNPGNIPAGIATLGLSSAPVKTHWSKEKWDKFRDDLLIHLKAYPKAEEKYPKLDYTTVESTMSQFEKLLANLRKSSGEMGFPLLNWGMTYANERSIPTVTRSVSGESDDSLSTSGSGLEDLATMFVKFSAKEEGHIKSFVEAAPKASPLGFPLGCPSGTNFKGHISKIFQSVKSALSPSRDRRSVQYSSSSMQQPDSKRIYSDSLSVKHDSGPTTPRESASQFSHQDLALPHARRHEAPSLAPAPRLEMPQTKVVSSEEGESASGRDNAAVTPKNTSNAFLRNLPASETELEYTTKLAYWFYDTGNLTEADRLYKSLKNHYKSRQEFNPDYFRICLNQAQILCITGNYSESEIQLRSVLSAVESSGSQEPKLMRDTGKWLALSQLRQGKCKDAECTIESCLEKLPLKDKDAASLLSTLALVLASAGEFKRAWIYSKQVIYYDLVNIVISEDGLRLKAVDRRIYYQDHITREDYQSCLFDHACILSELGLFKDAAVANEVALEDMRKIWGPKHFLTLDAAGLRAWLLIFNNSNRQAVEEVQRTLRQTRERQGQDHPSTLQNVQTLVLMYKGQGRYSDAEETARYLVSRSMQSQSLGEDHPQTRKSKSILGEVLLALGKWEEAEEIQKSVADAEPDNNFFRTSLAAILRTRGKWDEARERAVQVLSEQLHKFINEDDGGIEDRIEFETEEICIDELRRLLYESEYVKGQLLKLRPGLLDPPADSEPVRVYPSLIQSLYCVALCEQVREDASLMFVHGVLEKLHDIFSRRIGERHRLTINVEYDLAVNHRLRGNFKISKDMIDGVISERRKLLDTDHPDYLLARHQRAVTLLRLGKWKDALMEQASTLKAQEFLLGEGHNDTTISRYTLAGIYHSLRRVSDANDLIDQVIDKQIQRYNLPEFGDDDHPIVLRSRARRALILVDRRLYAQAEEEQHRVFQWRLKYLKEYHHLTRSANNDLAQIKQAAEHFEEAREIYKDLLQSFKKDRKRNHDCLEIEVKENPLEFQVRSNLASCYFEMADYENAECIQSKLREELCNSQSKKRNDQREIVVTFNLALTKRMMGKIESTHGQLGALELLQIATKRAEEILTSDHPQVQELQATLKIWKRELK